MPIRKQDVLKALGVLQDCRRRSAAMSDMSLTMTLDKAIVAMRSKLFVAILDIHEFYVTSIEASVPQSGQVQQTPVTFATPAQPTGLPPMPCEEATPPPQDPANGADRADTAQVQECIETIVLDKGGGGLGLSIAGGVDNPHIDGHPGIFITKILPETVAERDGRLRLGDQILSVNGVPLEAIAHPKAVEALKLAGQRVTLVIKHNEGCSSPVLTLDRRTLQK